MTLLAKEGAQINRTLNHTNTKVHAPSTSAEVDPDAITFHLPREQDREGIGVIIIVVDGHQVQQRGVNPLPLTRGANDNRKA